MSRIRTIKPEFCTSEQVGECSPTARLLFVLMWMHCDDYGNIPAKVMQLKASCFPMDAFDRATMEGFVGELLQAELLREYVGCDGVTYWHVTGWEKHQKIDRPSQKHPKPEESGWRGHGEFVEISSNDRRGADEATSRAIPRKGMEGNGREWKGVESKGREETKNPVYRVAALPSSSSPAAHVDRPPALSRVGDVQTVVNHFQTFHPKAKPGAKERKLIAARLKDGFSCDELCEAIDGMHKTPHNLGVNDRNTRYLTLFIAMKDSSQVERFMANNRDPPAMSKNAVTRSAESAIKEFVTHE